MNARTSVKSPWLILCILLLGIFITLESISFVTPALPYITAEFGISVGNSSMLSVAYFITAIALSPLFGRLGDQRGRKNIIALGLIVFSVAQFAAAFSPNVYILLLAFLIQGLGYSCIFPNVFAYIPELFEDANRGKAIGLFMLFSYVATGSGGVIAGILVNNFGWGAIFLFSGIFSLIGFFLILLFIPKSVATRKTQIDVPGISLFMLTVTSIITLPLFISNFGLMSFATITAIVVGIISLIVLIIVERKTIEPVVDLTVLKIKSISASAIIITCQNITMISILSCLSFFAASKAGWSAVEIGLITTVNFTVAALISPLVGAFLDRYKPAILVTIALISSLIGAMLFISVNMQSSLFSLLLVMVFIGFCSGCINASLMKIVVTDTPNDKKGVGTGTFGMFKDLGIPLGSTFGLTLYGAAQSSKLDSNLTTMLMDAGVEKQNISATVEAIKTGEVSSSVEATLAPLNLQMNEVLMKAQSLSTTEALHTVGIVNLVLLMLIFLISFTLYKRKKVQVMEEIAETT